jgi:hypothetical protein
MLLPLLPQALMAALRWAALQYQSYGTLMLLSISPPVLMAALQVMTLGCTAVSELWHVDAAAPRRLR